MSRRLAAQRRFWLSKIFRLFVQVHWSQSHINLPADAGDESWQGFDILQRGAEVDDAGAQQEPPSHDRIGEEGFATPLQADEQFRIQLVQVRFDLL